MPQLILTSDSFIYRIREILNRFGDKAVPPKWLATPRHPSDQYAYTTWLIDRLRLTVLPPPRGGVLWTVKWRICETDETSAVGFTLPDACLSLLEEWEPIDGDSPFDTASPKCPHRPGKRLVITDRECGDIANLGSRPLPAPPPLKNPIGATEAKKEEVGDDGTVRV